MALTDLFSSILPGDMPSSSGSGSPVPSDSGGGGIMGMILPLILGGAAQGLSALLGGGINKNINQAEKAQNQTIASTVQGGADQVKAAQAGQLTPAQQAQVDQMKREQNAKMQQAYANLGIPTSTMQAQSANEIDQNALAFANQLINTSFQQGIQAMQLGNQAAQAQLAQASKDKADLTSTITNAAQTIGKVLGTNPTPQPAAPATANVPTAWSNPYDSGYGNDPYANTITVDQT